MSEVTASKSIQLLIRSAILHVWCYLYGDSSVDAHVVSCNELFPLPSEIGTLILAPAPSRQMPNAIAEHHHLRQHGVAVAELE